MSEPNQTAYSAEASPATIRAGIGGWTFEPWEGTFYPEKWPKKRQLEYAARQLSTIEINGTYYRDQNPATFASWRTQVPDGFVFSVKANRFTTAKRVLAESSESIYRFIRSGIAELGPALGPIVWQFAPTKKFDPEDFAAWLALLPQAHEGVALRHALEVRHPSFACPEFVALARRHGAAIVHAHHQTYPEIADVTAGFVYSRLQRGSDDIPTAYSAVDMALWAGRARHWAAGRQAPDLPLADPATHPEETPREVFVYFIHEGKIRAPQAAMEFQRLVATQA